MNLRHCRIIAKKELSGLYSEKTIILAIALQLFIAMFSSFLMIGLATMYDPDTVSSFSRTRYPVAISGSDSPIGELLEESGDFRVFEMDLSTAVAALRERKLAAVIFVPDTPPEATDPIKVTLYTIENDIQTTVVNVKLKEIFLAYEQQLRDIREDRLDFKPIPVEISPAGGGDFFEFVFGLLIPLLVFMPAIISSALVIDLITEEYQHETLEVLMATPVTFPEMVWGKIAAAFVLVPVQAGAWLVLLAANGIHIKNILPVLLHVSAASFFLILLGTISALYYRDRTDAQFIFSTGLVIVILLALALPVNPLNLIVRLSVGSVGVIHWLVLLGILGISAGVGYVTTVYAGRVGERIFSVR